MRVETAFGLGEIVLTKQKFRGERLYQDFLLEVIGIGFDRDATPYYVCRLADSGQTIICSESELIGDPAFDQTSGAYIEGLPE